MRAAGLCRVLLAAMGASLALLNGQPRWLTLGREIRYHLKTCQQEFLGAAKTGETAVLPQFVERHAEHVRELAGGLQAGP